MERMTNKEAIKILKRLQDPEPWEPQLNSAAYDALDMAISALEKQEGDWNNHKVACLLAEMFDDDCACNFNGIDEWLPMKCDFAGTTCPNPAGVACWEQFLKHRSDEHGAD
jgi:hypothetical protein